MSTTFNAAPIQRLLSRPVAAAPGSLMFSALNRIQAQQPSTNDIQRQLYLLGAVGRSAASPDRPDAGQGEEPTILDNIFAAMDAPGNAIQNIIKNTFSDDPNKMGLNEVVSDFGKDIGSLGAAGYQTLTLNDQLVPGNKLGDIANKLNPARSTSELLDNSDYFKNHPVQKFFATLGGDIATDPWSYVGPGLLKSVGGRVFATGAKDAVVAATAEKAGREVTEDIFEGSAKGRPTIAPTTRDMVDEGAAPIRPKTFKEHITEAMPDFLGPESRPQRFLAPEVDTAISGHLATKLGTEIHMLRDSKLASSAATATDEIVARGAQVAEQFANATADAVKSGVPNASESTQVLMWNKNLEESLAENVSKGGKSRIKKSFKEALAKQRAGEDHLDQINRALPEGTGVPTPITFSGVPMRLSDILARLPVPKNANEAKSIDSVISHFAKGVLDKDTPDVIRKTVQESQAASVVSRPGFVSKLDRYANEEYDRLAAKGATPAELAEPAMQQKIAAAGIRGAVHDQALRSVPGVARLSMQGAHDVAKIVEKHFNQAPQDELHRLYIKNMESMTDGIVHQATVEAETKLLSKAARRQLNKMKRADGVEQAVVLTNLGRFGLWLGDHATTWSNTYGLERGIKSLVMPASQYAIIRAAKGRRLLKEFTKDERKEAWNALMGKSPKGAPFTTDRAEQAYKQLKPWHDQVLGDTSTLGTMGIAQRSNVLMEGINRQLNRLWGPETKEFRFRSDLTNPKTGEPIPWWESHKHWDYDSPNIKGKASDPMHFMYDLDLAIEREAKLHGALYDLGARLGTKLPHGEFTHVIDHPALKGVYFPPWVADGASSIIKHYEKGNFAPTSQFTRFYSKALRAWKSSVTIYRPAHHIRNMIGDMWFMWLAGHNDVNDVYRGLKTLKAFGQRYGDVVKNGSWEDLDKFVGGNPTASSVIFRHGNQSYTAADVYHGAFSRGVLLRVNELEDLGAEGVSQLGTSRIMHPFNDRVHNAVTKGAEYREHSVRLSHFIAATRKNLKKGMGSEKAMDRAAEEVRKWHPDATDLTFGEQKWARNFVPFYSWTRKALPLVIESALTRPAKVVAAPRAFMALGQATGVQGSNPEGDLSDPFPDEFMFPSFLRESGIGPVGLFGGEGLSGILAGMSTPGISETSGQEFGTTTIDPGNPFNDIVSNTFGAGGPGPAGLVKGISESIGGLLTPGVKIPGEALSRSEWSTGQPIGTANGLSWQDWLMKQAPPAQQQSSLFPGLQPNKQSILNWLTGLGIVGNQKYQKNAEYEAKDRAIRNK